MTENVYIHIPFCKSKCKYCSFVSYPAVELKKQYLEALEKEIKNFYKGEELDTLYFGGGTPSILTSEEFDKLINLFNINKKTEITAELNPEFICEDYLRQLKYAGINRLSFGCQTFDDDILKLIGRRHCAKDVENVIHKAFNAGFENISLDLIYGLPSQTLDIFEKDLKHAASFEIKHISLYGLKIDEGCYFYNHIPQNLPDEDIQADMYIKACEIMEENDYQQYEISNFSQKGFKSRHNLNYWNNNSYYGFGAAAHGYENGIRYYNPAGLNKYITSPVHEHFHKLSNQEKLEEEIFLGFRKSEGIDIELINKKFNIDFCSKYKPVLEKYLPYGYLKRTKSGFKLTLDGILISNTILCEFLQ